MVRTEVFRRVRDFTEHARQQMNFKYNINNLLSSRHMKF